MHKSLPDPTPRFTLPLLFAAVALLIAALMCLGASAYTAEQIQAGANALHLAAERLPRVIEVPVDRPPECHCSPVCECCRCVDREGKHDG